MAEKDPVDPLKEFAEALRSKGGVENRSGVLEGVRFELFRGKDLVRWVKANPDKGAKGAGGKGGEGPEEQARYLGQQLVRRQLARRVDRAVKKPAPGSKKLVKFPRKLAQLPPGEATAFVEDGFYIWLYERPASPWTYVYAALIPLVVVGCCLFPLAPNWAKLGVFYLSSGLLTLMMGVLALRSGLALATWLAAGRAVWLLPNLMSEELPVTQIFRPLVGVAEPQEGGSKWGNHPATRAAVGAVAAVLLYVLYAHSPDKAAIKTEAGRYRDDLMDWLGLQREGYQKLGGNATAGANATQAAGNATEVANATAGAGGSGAAEVAAAAGEAADAAGAGGETEL